MLNKGQVYINRKTVPLIVSDNVKLTGEIKEKILPGESFMILQDIEVKRQGSIVCVLTSNGKGWITLFVTDLARLELMSVSS
jgi:hypothetical protein